MPQTINKEIVKLEIKRSTGLKTRNNTIRLHQEKLNNVSIQIIINLRDFDIKKFVINIVEVCLDGFNDNKKKHIGNYYNDYLSFKCNRLHAPDTYFS